jgi:hypothetical protein
MWSPAITEAAGDGGLLFFNNRARNSTAITHTRCLGVDLHGRSPVAPTIHQKTAIRRICRALAGSKWNPPQLPGLHFPVRLLLRCGISDLDQNPRVRPREIDYVWQPIASAPFDRDRDLELAVIGEDGVHALVFPCRRILGGWIRSETKERVFVRPTHWREWQAKKSD